MTRGLTVTERLGKLIMDVSSKVFVVTGGGNGIGREVVLGLLARGARVAAVDVRQSGLAETAALAGARSTRLSTHVVDITDRTAVEKLPGDVAAVHRQVDGLLDVAGIVQRFARVQQLGRSTRSSGDGRELLGRAAT